MPTEFVRARHAGVEGQPLIPKSAFRLMPGWEPVDPDVEVPSLVDGTIAEVEARIGDDPAKAAVALEQERAGKNRTTLVERLSEIADQSQEG